MLDVPKAAKKKSSVVVEKENITLKATSRINTGIKKRPPSEVKLGTKTTKRVVEEGDE